MGNAASMSEAREVMVWFGAKGEGKIPEEGQPITEKTLPIPSSWEGPLAPSTCTNNEMVSVNVHPPTANLDSSIPRSAAPAAPGHPNRTHSVATEKRKDPLERSFILSPMAKYPEGASRRCRLDDDHERKPTGGDETWVGRSRGDGVRGAGGESAQISVYSAEEEDWKHWCLVCLPSSLAWKEVLIHRRLSRSMSMDCQCRHRPEEGSNVY